MDDTSVLKPEAHVPGLRKPLSGLVRLAAALSLAGIGLVAGPLSHGASADVTYCRSCQNSASHGGASFSGFGGGSGSWTTPQNSSN